MVCGTGYARRPRGLSGVSKRLASAGRLWENGVCWNSCVALMCHLAFERVKFNALAGFERFFVAISDIYARDTLHL